MKEEITEDKRDTSDRGWSPTPHPQDQLSKIKKVYYPVSGHQNFSPWTREPNALDFIRRRFPYVSTIVASDPMRSPVISRAERVGRWARQFTRPVTPRMGPEIIWKKQPLKDFELDSKEAIPGSDPVAILIRQPQQDETEKIYRKVAEKMRPHDLIIVNSAWLLEDGMVHELGLRLVAESNIRRDPDTRAWASSDLDSWAVYEKVESPNSLIRWDHVLHVSAMLLLAAGLVYSVFHPHLLGAGALLGGLVFPSRGKGTIEENYRDVVAKGWPDLVRRYDSSEALSSDEINNLRQEIYQIEGREFVQKIGASLWKKMNHNFSLSYKYVLRRAFPKLNLKSDEFMEEQKVHARIARMDDQIQKKVDRTLSVWKGFFGYAQVYKGIVYGFAGIFFQLAASLQKGENTSLGEFLTENGVSKSLIIEMKTISYIITGEYYGTQHRTRNFFGVIKAGRNILEILSRESDDPSKSLDRMDLRDISQRNNVDLNEVKGFLSRLDNVIRTACDVAENYSLKDLRRAA